MKILFFSLILLGSLQCAIAEPTPLGKLIIGGEALFESDRWAAAKGLEKDLVTVNEYIPNPSPADEAWVNREQVELSKLTGHAYSSRAVTLVQSNEFTLKDLKSNLTRLIALVRHIQSGVSTEVEIRDWCEVSSILVRDTFEEGYQRFVQKNASLIPKNIKSLLGNGRGAGLGGYRMIGNGIISAILLPYLDYNIENRTGAMRAVDAKKTELVFVKYRGVVDIANFNCATTVSSLVHRICYDNKNQYLIVLLGDTYYHYCSMPSSTVEEWLSAESKGSFYNAFIKGNFDCRLGGIPN